jgi:hypothetical protein
LVKVLRSDLDFEKSFEKGKKLKIDLLRAAFEKKCYM